MSTPDWTEYDVSSWATTSDENRGLRAKVWVQSPDDGSHWLRKSHRPSRPHEVVIEHLMLHLAGLSGLRAAESRVCSWDDLNGRHRGLLSRLFVDRSQEQLVSGGELLHRSNAAYNAERKWEHTVPAAINALENAELPPGMIEEFVHMLLFDLWIGNGDRHQANWSVIAPTIGPARLAPMYDPAGCMGAELQDDHPLLVPTGPDPKRLEGYIDACPSGFGDGKVPLKLAALVAPLQARSEWTKNAPRWLAEFETAMDTFMRQLAAVEPQWLPSPRRLLIECLLAARLAWLERRILKQ